MTPALLVVALGLAAPVKEPKTTADALVGKWAAESVVMDGEAAQPRPRTTWTFTPDWKSILAGGDQDSTEGTYKVDPTKEAAEIDISAGPKGGRPVKGLYRVEGDTLSLCLVGATDERPKKFEAPAESKAMVITFKRFKKKD
jgi:uncharacterized protein (TIGR03067 family)